MNFPTLALDPRGFAADGRMLRTEDIDGLKVLLRRIDRSLEDAERIEQIRKLDELVCAAQAAQARLSVDLDASMRARAAERGVPPERQGRGIAAQVAFARRESLHRGQRHLALAKVAGAEMPCTHARVRSSSFYPQKHTVPPECDRT